MKTPFEKATVSRFSSDGRTFVVVDEEILGREVLKSSIKDSDVQKLLPFQTSLGEGSNHIHIRNESAYTVETNSHFIHEGETLCQRAAWTPRIPYVHRQEVPTCPGCLAKAKAIIVQHLLTTEPELS